MATAITAAPRLCVKVYLNQNQAIPPGIFRTGIMDFRPYGDAIPQSVNVPRHLSRYRGFVTKLALVTDGLAWTFPSS